jgi:hypothetical protein
MKSLNRRGFRWALLIFVASCWMSMGVLSDCDPTIAGQVLSGVGAAAADVAAVLIEAVFDQITPTVPTPVTTGT